MEVRCGRSDGGNDLGGSDRASGGENSILGTSEGCGVVRIRHGKGLLTKKVEAAENTKIDKTTRYKKIKAMALISC